MTDHLQDGVVIIGGGISGSALAISLARRGIKTTVIERQAVWHFQSSGLFVYSNGLMYLKDIGVLEEVLAAGFAIDRGRSVYLDREGELITEVAYPDVSNSGLPPILGIKRAELHRVLSHEMERLGVTTVLGMTVTAINDCAADSAVRVVLGDGSHLLASAVVGADGIRSQTREHLFGKIEPTFTGFGVWRSIHRRPADLTAKIMMMGVGQRVGLMPISDDSFYIFGTTNDLAKDHYGPDELPKRMRQTFDTFGEPVSAYLRELSDQDGVIYTAVEEILAPLPWHRGRVGVIGDAAHASTPFLGQGAAMGLLDAVVLANLLTSERDVASAFESFGKSRFDMCRFVQEASRRIGEAGSHEDVEASALRDAKMVDSAQLDIDTFYSGLLDFHLA